MFFFIKVFIFTAFLTTSGHSSGFFRLQIVSGAEKWSVASVCLREWSSTSGPQDCTFGQKSDSVTSGIRIPFSFRWTGSFALLLLIGPHKLPLSEAVATPDRGWKSRTLVNGSSAFVVRWRVDCDLNYHGSDCATFCRPRSDTFGHFNCSADGHKICHSGWLDANCDRPKCRDNCHQIHGFCETPEECNCRSGWKGEHCLSCIEYPGCLHGYCVSPWQCTCHRNWGGVLCDQDLNYCGTHAPCLNNGQCQNIAPDHYRCHCPIGFAGANCQVVVDACAPAPCLHGGRCLSKVNGSAFECVCADGWAGLRCERDVNECLSNPCSNGGTCHDLNNDYKCQCFHGFQGKQCEEDIDECERLKPCVRALQCLNTIGSFECLCEAGFEGKHCETEVNDCYDVTCHNGGHCLDLKNDFRCVCRNHFFGKNCQSLDSTVCADADPHYLWTAENKICLCSDWSPKCLPEVTYNESRKCPPEVISTLPEMEVFFEEKVPKVCDFLQTIHSLVNQKSRDFCCVQSSETSFSVRSDHVIEIRKYLSAKIFPKWRTIVANNGSPIDPKKAIILSIVFILFLILLLVIGLVFRRRLLGRHSSAEEVVIHCIQNNLKENNFRANNENNSKYNQKLFSKKK